MRFELGKTYIVEVTENGIIPREEFDEDRWYDKDHDDLDFLTDEEKAVVVTQALEDVKAEAQKEIRRILDTEKGSDCHVTKKISEAVAKIIDKAVKEIKHE